MSKLTVLIPNAVTPKNIGDQAMLTKLIEHISESFPSAKVIVHGSDPHLQKKSIASEIRQSVDAWVGDPQTSVVVRAIKLFRVLLQLILLKLHLPFLREKNTVLTDILENYMEADLIIFVGGGSIRSKKGFKESLFLILSLLTYFCTKFTKSHVIVTPISFGPFGYNWHKKLAFHSLKHVDELYIREYISLKLAHESGLKKAKFSPDLALSTKTIKKYKYNHKKVLGITLRDWLSKNRQEKLETELIKGLIPFVKKYNLAIKPIVQVNGIDSHYDYRVTKRVSTRLKKAKLPVHEPIILESVNQACKTYTSIDLLLGMRMHSNILAATQGVPFVGIEYEHKTRGIAQVIGMEKWVINCEDLTSNKIKNLLNSAYIASYKISQELVERLKYIKNQDKIKWKKVFKKYSLAYSKT